MNLPAGVFERPRESILIAKGVWGVIRIDIDQARYPNNAAYKEPEVYEYDEALSPFLRGDWDDFDRLFKLYPGDWKKLGAKGEKVDTCAVFSRAEHGADPVQGARLPNIMVVPNLVTKESRGLSNPLTVLGCTMGHYHPPHPVGSTTQEVVEFQSYGMLALDQGKGNVELWVARDGDKVSIPSGSYKTLYNLRDGDNHLITLDFSAAADPSAESSYALSKMEMARQCGPILLVYYDNFEVVFTLNRLYINSPDHSIGVRLPGQIKEKRGREVRVPRMARLDLGELLYEELTGNPDLVGRFAQLGIIIKKGSPEATLASVSPAIKPPLYFYRPLTEAARKGSKVYRHFFPKAEKMSPPRAARRASRDAPAREPAPPAHADDACRPLNRPLSVVVEGSGDWVEKTYRKLFKKKVDDGRDLAVFYADDTRWKDSRPRWADPERWTAPDAWEDPATTGLQPWEVYLDKKNPEDFARYMNLRPDVVFVVTPDFTHSAVARHWLGKSPLVFVEKPFDSQVKNVDDLKLRYAFEETTKILGLDHYQFYALPIIKYKDKIREHLGGLVNRVEFYLTENHPIENTRLRSLQYGLTLDLLPHLIALLTFFGDIRTIDQIEVLEAGQYDTLPRAPTAGAAAGLFQGETYSRVRFTFEDESRSGYHIPCLAVVGKGFAREVKYLQVTGRHENAIRVDLLDRAKVPEDVRAASPEYRFDSLFFISGEVPSPLARDLHGATLTARDPYRAGPELRILPAFAGEDSDEGDDYCRALLRSRYEVLIDDLLEETARAVTSALRVSEGQEIVRALDRIWWAIQRKKEFWRTRPLGKDNPINDEAWN
jgi:hypothetical protein